MYIYVHRKGGGRKKKKGKKNGNISVQDILLLVNMTSYFWLIIKL